MTPTDRNLGPAIMVLGEGSSPGFPGEDTPEDRKTDAGHSDDAKPEAPEVSTESDEAIAEAEVQAEKDIAEEVQGVVAAEVGQEAAELAEEKEAAREEADKLIGGVTSAVDPTSADPASPGDDVPPVPGVEVGFDGRDVAVHAPEIVREVRDCAASASHGHDYAAGVLDTLRWVFDPMHPPLDFG